MTRDPMTKAAKRKALEDACEVFRLRVLAALDDAAAAVFSELVDVDTSVSGAEDGDLGFLFPTIDRHVKRLAVRYEVEWSEDL